MRFHHLDSSWRVRSRARNLRTPLWVFGVSGLVVSVVGILWLDRDVSAALGAALGAGLAAVIDRTVALVKDRKSPRFLVSRHRKTLCEVELDAAGRWVWRVPVGLDGGGSAIMMVVSKTSTFPSEQISEVLMEQEIEALTATLAASEIEDLVRARVRRS